MPANIYWEQSRLFMLIIFWVESKEMERESEPLLAALWIWFSGVVPNILEEPNDLTFSLFQIWLPHFSRSYILEIELVKKGGGGGGGGGGCLG